MTLYTSKPFTDDHVGIAIRELDRGVLVAFTSPFEVNNSGGSANVDMTIWTSTNFGNTWQLFGTIAYVQNFGMQFRGIISSTIKYDNAVYINTGANTTTLVNNGPQHYKFSYDPPTGSSSVGSFELSDEFTIANDITQICNAASIDANSYYWCLAGRNNIVRSDQGTVLAHYYVVTSRSTASDASNLDLSSLATIEVIGEDSVFDALYRTITLTSEAVWSHSGDGITPTNFRLWYLNNFSETVVVNRGDTRVDMSTLTSSIIPRTGTLSRASNLLVDGTHLSVFEHPSARNIEIRRFPYNNIGTTLIEDITGDVPARFAGGAIVLDRYIFFGNNENSNRVDIYEMLISTLETSNPLTSISITSSHASDYFSTELYPFTANLYGLRGLNRANLNGSQELQFVRWSLEINPDVPSITLPASGSFVSYNADIRLEWSFNSSIGATQEAFELSRRVGTNIEYWNGSSWQSASNVNTRVERTTQTLGLAASQWIDSGTFDSVNDSYPIHYFKIRVWDNTMFNSGNGLMSTFSDEISLRPVAAPTAQITTIDRIDAIANDPVITTHASVDVVWTSTQQDSYKLDLYADITATGSIDTSRLLDSTGWVSEVVTRSYRWTFDPELGGEHVWFRITTRIQNVESQPDDARVHLDWDLSPAIGRSRIHAINAVDPTDSDPQSNIVSVDMNDQYRAHGLRITNRWQQLVPVGDVPSGGLSNLTTETIVGSLSRRIVGTTDSHLILPERGLDLDPAIYRGLHTDAQATVNFLLNLGTQTIGTRYTSGDLLIELFSSADISTNGAIPRIVNRTGLAINILVHIFATSQETSSTVNLTLEMARVAIGSTINNGSFSDRRLFSIAPLITEQKQALYTIQNNQEMYIRLAGSDPSHQVSGVELRIAEESYGIARVLEYNDWEIRHNTDYEYRITGVNSLGQPATSRWLSEIISGPNFAGPLTWNNDPLTWEGFPLEWAG